MKKHVNDSMRGKNSFWATRQMLRQLPEFAIKLQRQHIQLCRPPCWTSAYHCRLEMAMLRTAVWDCLRTPGYDVSLCKTSRGDRCRTRRLDGGAGSCRCGRGCSDRRPVASACTI